MLKTLQIIILAAGRGTRMKSELSKNLHSLGGQPILYYVLDLAHKMTAQNTLLVVDPTLKDIQTPFSHQTIVQNPAQGTGDAVKCALPYLKKEGYVLILFGDTPLILKETLDRMSDLVYSNPTMALVVCGMQCARPNNYARLVLNKKGELEEIIEAKDLKDIHKDISLCNSGVMLVNAKLLEVFLSEIKPNNAAKEYYLTDLVKIARLKGYPCGIIEGNSSEFMGINTRQDLACAAEVLQDRWRHKAMSNGVTLINPSHVYFSHDTELESDVTVHPFVTLGTGVKVQKGAEILSFCQISDTVIGSKAIVGPFVHLRRGVHLHEKAEVGNFVEIKNSSLGPKAKAKHLSYIGDASIGAKTNIGAGTITCNYDGFNKFETHIGEGVFIGSNSALIAPLSIGDYAIVGAGSIVTKNVKSCELVIARSEQMNFEEGAKKFRDKRTKRKGNQ